MNEVTKANVAISQNNAQFKIDSSKQIIQEVVESNPPPTVQSPIGEQEANGGEPVPMSFMDYKTTKNNVEVDSEMHEESKQKIS